MSTYPRLRTIHLLFGTFALPVLLLYGVSAVQMAHPKWFAMKPAVRETTFVVSPRWADGRTLAREIMRRAAIRGEITEVEQTRDGWDIRVVLPGAVHEIRYNRTTGIASIRSSVARLMGVLNRLHHAAGLWHTYLPLNLWGVLVGFASAALFGLGVTGLWMWWLRKQERKWGLVVVGVNLASITVLALLRAKGP